MAQALRAEKIARLTINGGRPGDEEVEVVLEHSKDYRIFPCIDHYLVQVGSDGGFVIKKSFCADAIPHELPEVVEPKDKEGKVDERWYSLHPLFIPDTEVKQEDGRWNEALQTEISWELANPRFDLQRRLLAQPSGEFLKKVLEKTAVPAAGQAFFQLLLPLEARLAGLADQEKSAEPVKQNAGSFAAAVTNPKLNASEGELNLFLKLAFPEKSLGKIQKKVRAVIFSEYPLLPEEQLEPATNKITDWVCRRILWEAAFAYRGKTPPLNAGKEMSPEQTEFFQQELVGLFLSPTATSREVEDRMTAFQMVVWGLQEGGILFSRETVFEFADRVRKRFDTEIGIPVIQKLESKLSGLSAAEQQRIRGRMEAVFQKGELPMRWAAWNAANLKEPDVLVGEIPLRGEVEIRASMSSSAGLAITVPETGSRQINRLTADGASQLLFHLKKLEEEGKKKVEGGMILMDRVFLEPSAARDYLKGILALGEKEELEIETQARHLLEIAIAGDFAETSVWRSPWLWSGIGVGTAALAGAAFFLLGGEESAPRGGPSVNGGGNGSNGNGNGNGPGPGPTPPDDGRGTPTTIGP